MAHRSRRAAATRRWPPRSANRAGASPGGWRRRRTEGPGPGGSCRVDRSGEPPVVHAVVGIAVACRLRTYAVDARTVPDRLNRRADYHAVRLTSSRLPCARFPRLRPFADDAATKATYSGATENGKGRASHDR